MVETRDISTLECSLTETSKTLSRMGKYPRLFPNETNSLQELARLDASNIISDTALGGGHTPIAIRVDVINCLGKSIVMARHKSLILARTNESFPTGNPPDPFTCFFTACSIARTISAAEWFAFAEIAM